jgi:exonuclease-1
MDSVLQLTVTYGFIAVSIPAPWTLRKDYGTKRMCHILGNALNNSKGTRQSHTYLSLIRHAIDVTVVFDGAPLPSKRETEISRRKSREDSLVRAQQLEAEGKSSEAHALYARSVDVTPEMAFKVTQVLRSIGIKVIVAPYEADAQLAYLSRNNFVDFVISEDSDLLVYGCSRVLYKYDYKTEKGREVVLSNIFKNHADFSRMTINSTSFLITCILSGCDYIPSLEQVGLRKAISIGSRIEGYLSDHDLSSIIKRVITLLKLSNIEIVDEEDDLSSKLLVAIQTFRHQTVFCLEQERLVPLTPLDIEEGQNFNFLGEIYDSIIAKRVANCEIHPETKMDFLDYAIKPEQVTLNDDKSSGISRSKKLKRQKPLVPIPSKPLTLFQCWNSDSKPSPTPPQQVMDVSDEDEESSVIILSPELPPVYKVTRIERPGHAVDLDQFALDVFNR